MGEAVLAMGYCIAVASGKGGTGKTSVCAGIATALAREGKRVLCIDCDVGLRNLDISLGLADTAPLSFQEVLAGSHSLDELLPHPQFPSLYFLTAPVNRTADQIDEQGFFDLVAKARDRFDYVFLDAPAGVETGLRLTATKADMVIVVTGSDPASMRDAARTGQLLELMGKTQVKLIVNRIDPRMVSRMALTVDDVMDNTALALLGIVPDDPDVVFAAAFGRPLLCHTKKGAAAAVARIASRLQGMPVPIPMKKL